MDADVRQRHDNHPPDSPPLDPFGLQDPDLGVSARVDAHTWVPNEAEPSPSRAEDDINGSDAWQLPAQSDGSTPSSRLTTPDIPLSGPPLPASDGVVKTSVPSRPPVIPPPPPTYPLPQLDRASSFREVRSGSSPESADEHPHHPLQRRPPPPPPPPPSPPSASPSTHNADVRPPPPPDVPPNERQVGPSVNRQLFHMPKSPYWLINDEQRAFGGSRAPRGGRKQSGTGGSSTGKPQLHPGNDSADTSSTFHTEREGVEGFSESDASTDYDPIEYQNERLFPPRLPVVPSHQTSRLQSKSSAVNMITSLVSQFEKSQSPRRNPRIETESHALSDHRDPGAEGPVASVASSLGEVETLWQRLKRKRTELNEIKTQMARERKDLRELRRKKDDADNAFMSVIRPILGTQRGFLHTSQGLLDHRLADMQRVRTEYHFLESHYEGMEVTLDEEEEELNGLETRFFSLLVGGGTKMKQAVAEGSNSGSSPNYCSDVPYALMGISPDGPAEDLHPLYIRLTTAVGNLHNAREEYDDLIFNKQQYEYDMSLNETTGKETSEEMKEFFEEFLASEVDKRESVSWLEREVEHFKQLCEEKKVMRKHMSVRMAYALDPHMEYEDMDLDDRDTILKTRKTLAHRRFSELLSQPDHVLATPAPLTASMAQKAATGLRDDHAEKREKERLAAKEVTIDRLLLEAGANGKTDFVNRWLLQELRLSPLNALLLHSTFVFTLRLRIRDTWRWQNDVLYYWTRDSTRVAAEERPSRIVADAGSNRSSRLGTPPMSRAASDSGVQRASSNYRRTSASDVATVHGEKV